MKFSTSCDMDEPWTLSEISQLQKDKYCIIPLHEEPTRVKSTENRGAAAAKSLQSCPTVCDPIDGRPPGSPVPGTLQARTLEWVAISFSNAWKWKAQVKSLSHVWLLATPWTAAHQAPLSMGFSRQEYWSGERWLKGMRRRDEVDVLFISYRSIVDL